MSGFSLGMVTAADFRDIYEYNWRVLRGYCDALSELPEEAVLKNREATYQSMKNIPLRDALLQVTFEQAHHLGELIALFWQQDVEPPEMTWIDVRMEITGIPGPS